VHDDAPSPADAMERVVEASKALLERRAELLRLEVEAGARRGVRAGVLGALAVGCGAVAWLSGVGVAYQLLAARTSSEVALGAVALAHGGLAATLAARARREAGAPR
jgi:hypothetical protein